MLESKCEKCEMINTVTIVMRELIIINSIILEHLSLWYHLAVVTHPLSHGPNYLLRPAYE
jgi:hypothetical protein